MVVTTILIITLCADQTRSSGLHITAQDRISYFSELLMLTCFGTFPPETVLAHTKEPLSFDSLCMQGHFGAVSQLKEDMIG